MIYFLQPIDGGPVKIGQSDDVPTRHRNLECVYKRQLKLLATMDGGRDEETAIHARFSRLRLGRTEQFRPAPELSEFIGCPLVFTSNPESIKAMPSTVESDRDHVPGLAAKLRQAREAVGLSQVEAGERSGVHHVSIAKFETNKSTPTLRVLYLLAEAYGVDVCDLLPEPRQKPREG